MIPQEKELHIPREIAVKIGHHDVRLVVNQAGDANEPVRIHVNDITSKSEITAEALKAIEVRHWAADPRFEQEELKDRLHIQLGDRSLEVFAFGDELSLEQREMLVGAIEQMYGRLIDKSLWTVESIQILPLDGINPKSGGPYRGREFPASNRLELYTAGLQAGPYRGGELPCTELEGTLTHELTHIILERELAAAWASADLGWKTTDGERIELPGGDKTLFYNTRPQECTTSYGALQKDDDRAESVIAYLYAPERLEPKRKEIIGRFLSSEASDVQAVATDLPVSLPEIPPEIHVTVSEKEKIFSGFGTPRVTGPGKPAIPLAEFRKKMNIQEPEF